jgi:hypothetical protein
MLTGIDRPQKSAQDTIGKVDELLQDGYRDVVDADLSKYFDTIPHSELLQCVARRIVDGQMLHLIKMWLKVPRATPDRKSASCLESGKNPSRPRENSTTSGTGSRSGLAPGRCPLLELSTSEFCTQHSLNNFSHNLNPLQLRVNSIRVYPC